MREPFKRDSNGLYMVWPEPDMVAFGALVRRCREGAGMSQRRVAGTSNISQSVISRSNVDSRRA